MATDAKMTMTLRIELPNMEAIEQFIEMLVCLRDNGYEDFAQAIGEQWNEKLSESIAKAESLPQKGE